MEHYKSSPDIGYWINCPLWDSAGWEFDRLNALQMLRNFLLKTVTWTVAVNRHSRVGDSRVVCHWKDKFPASGVYNVKSNDTMMRKIKINNYFEKQCLQCQLLLQPPLSPSSCSVCVSYDQDKDIFWECLQKSIPPKPALSNILYSLWTMKIVKMTRFS